jgi:hypothetical protein
MSIPQGCSLDELNLELDAMQTIARALAAIQDPETRLRILRWTTERFGGLPAAAPKPAPAARLQPASDPSLTVDGVHLFDDDGIIEMPIEEPVAVIAAAATVDQPLDSLVRGFATDFRALAMQWQRA